VWRKARRSRASDAHPVLAARVASWTSRLREGGAVDVGERTESKAQSSIQNGGCSSLNWRPSSFGWRAKLSTFWRRELGSQILLLESGKGAIADRVDDETLASAANLTSAGSRSGIVRHAAIRVPTHGRTPVSEHDARCRRRAADEARAGSYCLRE